MSKKYYIYDDKTLSYKESKFRGVSLRGFMYFVLVVIIFTVAVIFSYGKTVNSLEKKIESLNKANGGEFITTYSDLNSTKNKAWVDSTFSAYKERADLYLSRPIFKGTPLSGDLLSLCARNAYDSTGILVPVELALLQAQFESTMGLEGRSPVNNPFNIGEAVEGTTMWFESTFEGTQAYYYYMVRNYLSCRTTEQLLVNFVNCNGRRYAQKETYEITLSTNYIKIKNWIDRNSEQ